MTNWKSLCADLLERLENYLEFPEITAKETAITRKIVDEAWAAFAKEQAPDPVGDQMFAEWLKEIKAPTPPANG